MRHRITGENGEPHSVWYADGSVSVCSGTHSASQAHTVSSTFHRSRPRRVRTYSYRRGASEYWARSNTPTSVRCRNRAVSTELAMPSRSRKSL